MQSSAWESKDKRRILPELKGTATGPPSLPKAMTPWGRSPPSARMLPPGNGCSRTEYPTFCIELYVVKILCIIFYFLSYYSLNIFFLLRIIFSVYLIRFFYLILCYYVYINIYMCIFLKAN